LKKKIKKKGIKFCDKKVKGTGGLRLFDFCKETCGKCDE
jgi:hypothetical protein